MSGPSHHKEQAERREQLRQDRLPREPTGQSYFSRARAGLDDDSPGGRFSPDQIFSGSSPSVNYPEGPAWTRTAVPDEEPLGIDVNAMEPCGTHAEIEASLSNAAPASSGSQTGEGLTALSPAERKGAVPAFPHPAPGTAPTSHERLATILPKIAVPIPAPKRRKV